MPTCSCQTPGCRHVAALALLLSGGKQPGRPELELEDGQKTPREAERLRRTERAQSGLFQIKAAGNRGDLLGNYQVSSPSGRTYTVTLRTLDALTTAGTCQDFATNLLGTCKHIEAALTQRIARVHRLGQKNAVNAVLMVSEVAAEAAALAARQRQRLARNGGKDESDGQLAR